VAVGAITNIAAFDAAGQFVATAVEGRSRNGYGGEIVMMVGITAAGKVLDFKILSAKETPGLGTKIATPGFRSRIQGRALDANWMVRKDGGEIDGVTAATISSRAALEAIRAAIAAHQALTAQVAADMTPVATPTKREESAQP
jgi:electron transport complex protein RnfG